MPNGTIYMIVSRLIGSILNGIPWLAHALGVPYILLAIRFFLSPPYSCSASRLAGTAAYCAYWTLCRVFVGKERAVSEAVNSSGVSTGSCLFFSPVVIILSPPHEVEKYNKVYYTLAGYYVQHKQRKHLKYRAGQDPLPAPFIDLRRHLPLNGHRVHQSRLRPIHLVNKSASKRFIKGERLTNPVYLVAHDDFG